jgi:uncharacterized protein (TIGR02246 family)
MPTTHTEHGPSRAPASSGIDPTLARTWAEFGAAFNRHDVRGVADFFEEDGTLIGVTGIRGDGRPGVEKVLATAMERIFRGTASTFTIESVRKIGRELVLVDVEHAAQGARLADGGQGTRKLHVVALARKRGKGWKLLDVRPYEYAPMPPEAALH